MKQLILIADDEPDGLEMTADQLLAAGYDVVLATNGREALDLIAKCHPALAVLDIRMPDMTGYDVCEQLKQNPDLKDIPVLFVTANSTSVSASKVRAVCATDYLMRPYKVSALLQKVSDCIGA